MDIITQAIIAALSAGVASGTVKVVPRAINDAYNALKSILHREFGDDSDLALAVNQLEKKPDSESRIGVLAEAVQETNADKDPNILKTAQELIKLIQAQPGGEQTIQNIQNVYGNYNVVAGTQGSATMNINQSDEE